MYKIFGCLLLSLSMIGCAGSRDVSEINDAGKDSPFKERLSRVTSDNFYTSIHVFFIGFRNHTVLYFGESRDQSSHVVGDIQFQVMPQRSTHDPNKSDTVDSSGNFAAHLNEMALMLACKWIVEGNADGNKLLDIIKKENPRGLFNHPGLESIPFSSLSGDDKTRIEAMASQWSWREDLSKQYGK